MFGSFLAFLGRKREIFDARDSERSFQVAQSTPTKIAVIDPRAAGGDASEVVGFSLVQSLKIEARQLMFTNDFNAIFKTNCFEQ